jgi:uncharacterized membrane protein YhdT
VKPFVAQGAAVGVVALAYLAGATAGKSGVHPGWLDLALVVALLFAAQFVIILLVHGDNR